MDFQFSQYLRNLYSSSPNNQYIAHSAAETVAAAYISDTLSCKKLWGPGINTVLYGLVIGHSMTKMCTNSGFWENENQMLYWV